jgi:phospho-N-acetylmuramoyl-pentapeptide-transferase
VGTAFSVNQTDGLDGLAGGTLLVAFASYVMIAFATGRYDLAAFCGVIVGALTAFLWFNINPARFIMGDTGSISLGVTLAIVALYTNTAFILPFLGFIFVVEALSTIIQIFSKKFRKGKKVFLSSPIHHHFEVYGWSEPKIVMRFWLISGIVAAIGLIIFLLDKA